MDTDLSDELFGTRGDPSAGHARYQRVKVALTLIGFKKSKLYALIRQGRVRAVRLDGATFIDLASVAALFAKCPEIAPERHNTMTAEQLGLPVADLPAQEIDHAVPLSSIRFAASDLAAMEGDPDV
jgi:hypothetical protein